MEVGIKGLNVPGDLTLYIQLQQCGVGFIGRRVRCRDVITAQQIARGRITSWSKK